MTDSLLIPSNTGSAEAVLFTAITMLAWEYQPVLVEPRGKKPAAGPEWQKVRYSPHDLDTLKATFMGDYNIGLHLEASNLVDADLDSEWARTLAPAFLPESVMKWGRKSEPTSHWAWRPVSGKVKYRKYMGVLGTKDSEGVLLERRAGPGKHTVIPPSIHKETGEKIEWVPGYFSPAAEVDANALCLAFDKLAAAALILSIWRKDIRHDLTLAISGILAKAGAEQKLVQELIVAVVEAEGSDDPQLDDRLKAIEDTFAKYAAGDARKIAGFRQLENLYPEHANAIVLKLIDWLHLATGADSERATIMVNDRDWAEIVEDGYRALTDGNRERPHLFQQGGRLIRVRLDEEGKPRVETLSEAALKGILVHAARWTSMTMNGPSPVQPPEFVVQYILAKKEWSGMPPLRGVVEAPLVTDDGQIVLDRQYQPTTRLWFHLEPQFSIAPVSDVPSRGEIEAARVLLLDDLLIDFPFHDAASKAHAVALLVLPFVRELIDGPTPLHVVDAPTPGTGKGLLVDVAGVIATGRVPKKVSQPRDDEEWRKRITSQLIRSAGMIVIDNVAVKLDSGALAAVLTATEWEDRLLGANKVVEAPNRAVWVATGNNITMSNEIARRVAWIRLTPAQERPWERAGFKHDSLVAWVQANRGRLVHACLTLAKAWLANGRPDGKAPRLGSFEGWASVVGGILAMADIPGFLTNHAELYEAADAEMAPWREFIAAWAEHYGTKTIRADELYTLINLRGLLPEELGDERTSDRAKKTKLGIGLRKYRDRVIAGYRIRAAGTQGRPMYKLETAG
jgi:hypothetical protein